MFPQGVGAAGASLETGATLIVAMPNIGNSGATLGALGAQAGDILLGIGITTMRLEPGAINMSFNLGGGQYRVLTSGDLARAFTSNTSTTMLIYRGCASVAVAASDNVIGTAGTRTIAGFTKNAKHVGLVAGIVGTTGSTVSIGKPATFAQRGYYNTTGGNSRHLAADRLYPVNPPYVSGTPFEWSSTGSGDFRVYELRRA